MRDCPGARTVPAAGAPVIEKGRPGRDALEIVSAAAPVLARVMPWEVWPPTARPPKLTMGGVTVSVGSLFCPVPETEKSTKPADVDTVIEPALAPAAVGVKAIGI